ncbi:MAG: Dabb family protein [Planctomycetota bacterium]
MRFRPFALALALVALTACATSPSTSKPGDGSRLHVVLFWLKADMPASERAAMQTELAGEAQKVPGLLDCYMGGPAGTQRDVVDNSYDLMLVMRFADAAAAEGWDTDPLHLDLVKRFAPHFRKVVVYDGM